MIFSRTYSNPVFVIIYRHVLLALFLSAVCEGNAQALVDNLPYHHDSIILSTIDGENIYLREFEQSYSQSRANDSTLTTDKHLKTFIDYKLKIKEAIDLKYDTLPAVRSEFKKYEKEMQLPYLTDIPTLDALIEEAAARSTKDIRVQHVLAAFGQPKDTLSAYTKIQEAYQKLQQGKPFDSVVVAYSDERFAELRKGLLGDFSVFQIDYEIENQIYNLQIGAYSRPVRSRYGYHILRVIDHRPAFGTQLVAHIVKNNSASAKKEIQEAYNKWKAGASFEDLVKSYSDDSSTVGNAGQLPPLSSQTVNEPFRRAIESIDTINEVSAPFEGTFGWHIVKLLNRRTALRADKDNAYLQRMVSISDRRKVAERALVLRIEPGLSIYKDIATAEKLYDWLYESTSHTTPEMADTLSCPPEWAESTILRINEDVMDGEAFFREIQNDRSNSSFSKLWSRTYHTQMMMYNRDHLEALHPTYRFEKKRFVEQLALFERSREIIWDRYVNKDGLEKYYNEHMHEYASFGSYEKARTKVIADYVMSLENQWIASLRQKYDVKIYPEVIHTK